VCRISGRNVGYIMFRGSVKSTGYPLYSPVSPSVLLPCVTVCHHISTGVYIHPTAHSWFLLRFPWSQSTHTPRDHFRLKVYLYSFFNLGAGWGWVVNATPRPLYPRERNPVPTVLGGWMGPRDGLDGCGKSRPHQDFRDSSKFLHNFFLKIKKK
jgi:hypothetical protein